MTFLTSASGEKFSSVGPKIAAFTPGTYDNTIVVVFAGMGGTFSGQTLNSATYAGAAMTKGTSFKDSANNDYCVFYKTGVTAAGDIDVIGSHTDQYIGVAALAYSLVTGITGIVGESEGSTDVPAITVTSPSGNTALMFGLTGDAGANARITATPEVERVDLDLPNTAALFAIDTPGSGATALDATSVTARAWYSYGLSLTAVTTPLTGTRGQFDRQLRIAAWF